MSIQPLSLLTDIPYDIQVKTTSFLDLQSVLIVSQLNKTFHCVAHAKEIWQSVAIRIKVSEKLLQDDSNKIHLKTILLNQIENRISTFLFLEKIYLNLPISKYISSTIPITNYKIVLVMIANNTALFDDILNDDDVDWNPTQLDSFIETRNHSEALLPPDDKDQLKQKIQNPSLIKI